MLTEYTLFLMCPFLLSILLIGIYREIAKKKGLMAEISERSLHSKIKPKGSGIVFALIFISTNLVMFKDSVFQIENNLLLILLGCLVSTLFGFLDDIFNFSAKLKFTVQIILASFIVFIFSGGPLVYYGVSLWLALIPTTIVLVWILNMFNFMDGVDGLATTGSLFICLVLGTLSIQAGGDIENTLLFYLLAAVLLGFLIFNFPPASVFMGDAGSLFLGFIISALSFKVIIENNISIWTICIISGYFLTDTTMTTLMRIKMFKKWYGEHRSHAYQNLARIWNNHRKVTLNIGLFHLIWLLPLAFLSYEFAQLSPLFLILAITPVVYLNRKFGPTFSSD